MMMVMRMTHDDDDNFIKYYVVSFIQKDLAQTPILAGS